MPLTCNIDAKGKAIRLIYGAVLVVVGIVLLVIMARHGAGWMPWTISVLVLLGGAFAMFEGWNGWCVIRAMGIKTRF